MSLPSSSAQISPEMLDVIQALTASVRAGDEIAAFEPTATLTPNELAERFAHQQTQSAAIDELADLL